nr:methyltransferase domain-containing protein [Thermococcus sp.]
MELAKRGYRVTGIDISQKMLEKAKNGPKKRVLKLN